MSVRSEPCSLFIYYVGFIGHNVRPFCTVQHVYLLCRLYWSHVRPFCTVQHVYLLCRLYWSHMSVRSEPCSLFIYYVGFIGHNVRPFCTVQHVYLLCRLYWSYARLFCTVQQVYLLCRLHWSYVRLFCTVQHVYLLCRLYWSHMSVRSVQCSRFIYYVGFIGHIYVRPF